MFAFHQTDIIGNTRENKELKAFTWAPRYEELELIHQLLDSVELINTLSQEKKASIRMMFNPSYKVDSNFGTFQMVGQLRPWFPLKSKIINPLKEIVAMLVKEEYVIPISSPPNFVKRELIKLVEEHLSRQFGN